MDTAAVIEAFDGGDLLEWNPRESRVPVAVLATDNLPASHQRLLSALCGAARLDLDFDTLSPLQGLGDVLRVAPAVVLAVDQGAVDLWRRGRRSVSLPAVNGRIGLWVGGLVVAPLHLERMFGNRAAKAEAIQTLELVRWIAEREISPLDCHLPEWDRCAEPTCGAWVWTLDDQNLGWCREHGSR